jgi:hypothetical protein
MISQEEIRKFDAEQIAGIILTLLQEFESRRINPSHYGGSLGSINHFELAPKWLGKNVKNGVLIGNGYATSYGGDRPSADLQDLFHDAVEILRKEGCIC